MISCTLSDPSGKNQRNQFKLKSEVDWTLVPTIQSMPSPSNRRNSAHSDNSGSADMDIESSSSRGQAAPMPEIMLSFSNGAGGAWDDRELVNAYDAAMDEFHVGGNL